MNSNGSLVTRRGDGELVDSDASDANGDAAAAGSDDSIISISSGSDSVISISSGSGSDSEYKESSSQSCSDSEFEVRLLSICYV